MWRPRDEARASLASASSQRASRAPAESTTTGVSPKSSAPRARSALHAGIAARCCHMPRKAFGFDQCAWTAGSTSAGSFCTSPTRCSQQRRGGPAEQPAELAWRRWSAAAQQRQAKTHDAEAREQRSHLRQEDAAAKHAPLMLRGIAPFFRMQGIDEHESRDVCRMRAREGADDQSAERVPDEHIRRRDAGALEHEAELVDERSDGPRRSTSRRSMRDRRGRSCTRVSSAPEAAAGGSRTAKTPRCPLRGPRPACQRRHNGSGGGGAPQAPAYLAGQISAGRGPRPRTWYNIPAPMRAAAATRRTVQGISHNAQKRAKPV